MAHRIDEDIRVRVPLGLGSVRQRLFDLREFGFQLGDDAPIIRTPADGRWRQQDLQLAPDLVTGFGQLLAEGFVGVGHGATLAVGEGGRHLAFDHHGMP